MTPRLRYLRQRLSELELDAVLISQATNRRYLSGFTGSAGYLFITQAEAILATDFRYFEQSKVQAPDFEIIQITGKIIDWFPKLVSKVAAKRIGVESDDLTLTAYRQLIKAARKLPPKSRPRIVPTKGLVESLRAIKEPDELKSIEAAAELADAAVTYASKMLKSGITERELAWKLEQFLKERGSQSLPFEIIVASGPNSALPHTQPTDRQILPGEPTVIDLGARVNGYCSDITRTICLGEPGQEFVNIYRIVKEAQNAAMKKLRAGMSGKEADSLARGVITKVGYAESFGHGLGHGVGLDTHELPVLGPNSTDALTEGMIFTVEPGIYLQGWGGIRIEDMVSLESSGPRALTRTDKLNL